VPLYLVFLSGLFNEQAMIGFLRFACAAFGIYGAQIILEGLQYLSANWDSEKHRACLLHWLARVSVSDQWCVSKRPSQTWGSLPFFKVELAL
jgi:hypothetical protein